MSAALLFVLFVGGAVLFAVAGVLIGRKINHGTVREGHNDVLVPLFLTAGVIYAVLLGFTVIAEWEFYDQAKVNTAEEASLLVPLYRQTKAMADDKGDQMRHLIYDYAEHVVAGWENFKAGKRNSRAGKDANDIVTVFGTMMPATKARELIAAQFLQTFSQVILNRNKRYVHVTKSLSWVMWFGIIAGGIITVGMSFLIFMERRGPQIISTSVLSALIGILLFVVAMFSRPFHGPLAIEPHAFEQVLHVFEQIDSGS